MNQTLSGKSYFLCGVGGSGMLPLALILKARGAHVEGSDRSLDQGRTGDKFDFLRRTGIALHPQDGSGLVSPAQILVASAAIEATVPDVAKAAELGCARMGRAEMLAELFNGAPRSVAVGGTSGKSTTTGMIAWILHQTGRDPTVMNGAVMKNFMTPDRPFASAIVGASDIFVSEVDESDGTIALYRPHVAVLNNVAHDHKSMEELRVLFGDFLGRAARAVINLDNAEARALAGRASSPLTYSLTDGEADFFGFEIAHRPDGVDARIGVRATGDILALSLTTPGRHNVSNALAAIAAVSALGVTPAEAVRALAEFAGIRRRLEHVGGAGGVTVYDDFAHNPDKIAATLATLRAFDGRLLVMFQPHGYGPVRLMREGFIETFAAGLGANDVLLMPEPVYFGGTVDRSVGSSAITEPLAERGLAAQALPDRPACGARLLELARPGDRIVVMGARDDTLSEFAAMLVAELARRG